MRLARDKDMYAPSCAPLSGAASQDMVSKKGDSKVPPAKLCAVPARSAATEKPRRCTETWKSLSTYQRTTFGVMPMMPRPSAEFHCHVAFGNQRKSIAGMCSSRISGCLLFSSLA